MLLGLTAVLLLAWLRLSDPYPVRALRDIGFDVYEQLAPRPAADVPVRIVDVDEASLTALGQWPWPRSLLAKLATRLTELGAASIVFDFVFPEADRWSPATIAKTLGSDASPLLQSGALKDFDSEFASALAASPSVLGFGVLNVPGPLPARAKAGFAVTGDSPIVSAPPMAGMVESLPVLADAAPGMGSMGLDPTGSVGTVRRVPLLWSADKQLYPSLALEALRIAMGEESFVVLGDTLGQGTVDALRVGSIQVPTNADGSIWLYYQRTTPDLYVSAKDILGDDSAKTADLIAGNIVLIGTSATGLQDKRGTPFGYDMPGVEIHAQVLQQILSQHFLSRADWVSGLEVLAFVLIGLVIVVAITLSGPWICLAIGGVLGAGLVGGAWYGYSSAGVLIDISFPLLGALIVYTLMIFLQFTVADADKRKIRRAFGHYVAPTLLEQIEKNRHSLKLGGELRELSVFFLDIRSFTTLSEGVDPPRLVSMLNLLFNELGAEITTQFGTIDKFIGDSIMAFWNAPVDVDRHPWRACLATLGMRRRLAALNARDAFGLSASTGPVKAINIGMGICTGPALVGNLGLETQFDYSCIGDTVNVASRIEGASKTIGYDIAVSDRTRAGAAQLAFLDAGYLELKGKQEREHIHALVGDEALAETEAFRALAALHAQVLAQMTSGADASDLIDQCIAMAPQVEPGLVKFFQTVRGRARDFAPRAVPEATGAEATLAVDA